MVVSHIFPVDGDYSFTVTFLGGNNTRLEDVDISLNGERVSLVRYETQQAGAADGRGAVPMKTEPVHIKAGQYTLSAAFVRRFEGPYEDLIRPHDWSFAGAGSGGAGITTLPHVRDLIVHGPSRHDGHFGHGEPPQDLHVPSDVSRRRAAVRAHDRARTWR